MDFSHHEKDGFGTIQEQGESVFFRVPQIKAQGPSIRQHGPMEEEWDLIRTKKPSIFIYFDLGFATPGIYFKEEMYENAVNALCIKMFIAVVFF